MSLKILTVTMWEHFLLDSQFSGHYIHFFRSSRASCWPSCSSFIMRLSLPISGNCGNMAHRSFTPLCEDRWVLKRNDLGIGGFVPTYTRTYFITLSIASARRISVLLLSSFPLAHLHDITDIFLAGLKLCCSDEYFCFWVRSFKIWKITSIFTKRYIRFLAH